MKKYFRMVVQNNKTKQNTTYVSAKQGEAPPGYKCLAVVGGFETDKKPQTLGLR